jgi:hypothetical protein
MFGSEERRRPPNILRLGRLLTSSQTDFISIKNRAGSLVWDKPYCNVTQTNQIRLQGKSWVTDKRIEALPRTSRRGGGGHPTREEAVRRDARSLDVATKLFMERGFDCTSIDAVAEAAGVNKPTVYARYRDKRDLFTAVPRGTIQRCLAPLSAAAEAAKVNPRSVETTLHDVSRHFVAQMSAKLVCNTIWHYAAFSPSYVECRPIGGNAR